MRRLLPIIAAFGGLAATGARAEIDTTADAIRALHGQAECIVYRNSDASGIVGVAPGSQAERTLLRRLLPGCIGGAYHLDAQGQLLRGAIVERVLRLDDNNRGDGRRMRWVPPFTGLSEADVAALDERGRAALRALDFAQCVQAAGPDAVQALLDTRPTYSPEGDAFQQLAPLLGPCLPAGVEITISRPQLRGFLAEAAYRAAYAAHRRASSGE